MDAIPPSMQHEGLDDQKTQLQGMLEDELRSLQEGIPHTRKTIQESISPRCYPNWPTSREQDPERYWPDEDLKGRTGFDQLGTAQEQKKRGDDPTHPWSRHS